jgi:hypothetical protein
MDGQLRLLSLPAGDACPLHGSSPPSVLKVPNFAIDDFLMLQKIV